MNLSFLKNLTQDVFNMFPVWMSSKRIILNHTLPCLWKEWKALRTKGRSLEKTNSIHLCDDQIGNILGFTGHKVPVTTTQHCRFRMNV